MLEFETANPGQDFNDREAENFVFDEDNAASAADVARPDPVSSMDANRNARASNSRGRTNGSNEPKGNARDPYHASSDAERGLRSDGPRRDGLRSDGYD